MEVMDREFEPTESVRSTIAVMRLLALPNGVWVSAKAEKRAKSSETTLPFWGLSIRSDRLDVTD
jgi:hypothetical protein